MRPISAIVHSVIMLASGMLTVYYALYVYEDLTNKALVD